MGQSESPVATLGLSQSPSEAAAQAYTAASSQTWTGEDENICCWYWCVSSSLLPHIVELLLLVLLLLVLLQVLLLLVVLQVQVLVLRPVTSRLGPSPHLPQALLTATAAATSTSLRLLHQDRAPFRAASHRRAVPTELPSGPKLRTP